MSVNLSRSTTHLRWRRLIDSCTTIFWHIRPQLTIEPIWNWDKESMKNIVENYLELVNKKSLRKRIWHKEFFISFFVFPSDPLRLFSLFIDETKIVLLATKLHLKPPSSPINRDAMTISAFHLLLKRRKKHKPWKRFDIQFNVHFRAVIKKKKRNVLKARRNVEKWLFIQLFWPFFWFKFFLAFPSKFIFEHLFHRLLAQTNKKCKRTKKSFFC